MIGSCVSSVSYSIMLNGNVIGKIMPRRGLRQGNPLSPYLFILCSKMLPRLLLQEEVEGNLHGIRVGVEVPVVSHLLYVDDLLIACKVSEQDFAFAMECLRKYCRWFRQEVNGDKSSLIFSKNTQGKVRQGVRRIIGFREARTDTIYLGNSLILERSKLHEFERLKEKVQSQLSSWKNRLFSQAGKVTLIKAVVQAVPA